MPYFREEDIAGLLEEVGVDITLGGVTVKGVVDEVDQQLVDGESTHFMGKRRAVTVKTDTLPALETGAPIIVNGVEYSVQQHAQVGDGALTQIHCTASVAGGILKALANAVVMLLPPALRTVLTESAAMDLDGYEGDILVVLTSGARTTEFGGLTVTVWDCDTAAGTFAQIGTFTAVSEDSSVQVRQFTLTGIRRYLKVRGTITVPMGETGAFPYAVRLVGLRNVA